MNKRKAFIIIDVILILLTLSFIFKNSIESKQISNETSSNVYNIFKGIFDLIFGKDVITHNLFRKFAHFGEFFLLGAEVILLFNCVFNLNIKIYLLSLLVGLVVGFIDEGIQLISNRGASIFDVLVDFSGYLSSATIICLISIIIKIKRKTCD